MQTPWSASQCAAEAHVMLVTQPLRSGLQTCRSGPAHWTSPGWHTVKAGASASAGACADESGGSAVGRASGDEGEPSG